MQKYLIRYMIFDMHQNMENKSLLKKKKLKIETNGITCWQGSERYDVSAEWVNE